MKKPPLMAEKLLKLLTIYEDIEERLGDFEEEYLRKRQVKNRFQADIWYWIQVLIAIPSFVWSAICWSMTYMKMNFITGFRMIKNQKMISFLNISGLAIGMACCFFIFIFVNFHSSFDNFHRDSNRIYNVVLEKIIKDGSSSFGTNLTPMGKVIRETFPEVESSVRLVSFYDTAVIRHENHTFLEEAMFSESTVFDVFSFELLAGHSSNCLDDPDSIVISETLSRKLFANVDAVGKQININHKDYKITGVMKDVPLNSTLRFSILISWENASRKIPWLIGWKPLITGTLTYVKLKSGTDVSQFEKKIADLPEEYLGESLSDLELKYKNHLQPLLKSHLYEMNSSGMIPNFTHKYMQIFTVIGLMIMMIFWLNFINLSTARAANRSLEVGMRKVLGAGKHQLFFQFLGESFLISLIACLVALFFTLQWLPFFNMIADTQFTASQLMSPAFVLFSLLILAGSVIGAGAYPAFVMTLYSPSDSFSQLSRRGRSTTALRKLLIGFQFIFTTFLLIGTLFVNRQIDFMKTRPLGFNKDRKMTIQFENWDTLEQKYQVAKTAFENIPGVSQISMSSGVPGVGINRLWLYTSRQEGSTGFRPKIVRANSSFVEHFDIKVLASSPELDNLSDQGLNGDFLINEKAVAEFGYKSPEDAIHKTLYIGNSRQPFRIIGVVGNFNWYGLQQPIEPTIIRLVPMFKYVTLTVSGSDIRQTLSRIESKYRELFPGQLYTHFFVDSRFEQQYQQEKRIAKLMTGFTIIGCMIACIGLFGLITFIAEQHTREIGIRKVFGASTLTIIADLVRSFLIIVGVSSVVSWPLAYLAVSRWLQNFAYRTDLSPVVFIGASLGVVGLALLTVVHRAYLSATSNPVDALRHE